MIRTYHSIVYYSKQCELDYKPLINDLLSSVLSSKSKVDKDFKERNIDEYEKEIKNINDNKIKVATDTPVKQSGYSVYPEMKPVKPQKYDPSITLKDKNGKTIVIPYYFDGEPSHVALLNGKYIEMNEATTSLVDSILSERELHFEVPEDVYKLLGDKYIPLFRNVHELKLPKTLKENIYGDRFNLYWAYINDLMKDDKYFDGEIEKNLGKKVNFEKYTMANVKLTGLKRQDGLYLESKGSNAKSNVILVAVRDEKQKLIAAYLTSKDGKSFKCRYDGMSMIQINNKNMDKWVVGAFEKDRDFEEISKMNPEELIRKFYSFLDKNDNRAYKLYVPKISDYDGKISWNTPVMRDPVKNISYVKVKKVSPSNSNISDIRYPNKVDYYADIDIKYKEIIADEGGEEKLSFDLNKYPDGFGYRIIQYGY